MKICVVSNAFAYKGKDSRQKIGGAEICAERTSRALLENGHSVVVITHCRYSGLSSLLPREESVDGLKIYSFYPVNIFSIYNAHKKSAVAKGLWRILDLLNPLPAIFVFFIIKKEKPDIIHNHILHGFSPLVLLKVFKASRVPVVQTLHSYGFLCLRCDFFHGCGKICERPPLACRAFIAFSGFFAKSAISLVISPSQFSLDLYARYGFFPDAKIKVVPNGVEVYKENLHRKISKGNDFKILYSGRLNRTKGVHVLIEAFKQMDWPQAELTIIGEGPFEKQLAALAGTDKRIKFLGKMQWPQLSDFYRNSDVTIVPSVYYDIFPNAVLESISFGTPVIASRIGGIPEAIEDGKEGILFPPGDVTGLKNALKRFFSGQELREKMSAQAFILSKKYDLKTHSSIIEQEYSALINAR